MKIQYVIFFVLLLAVLLTKVVIEKSNQMEYEDSLVFFEASENIANGNHDKFALPWEEYFEWYKSKSIAISFSKSFYNKIFKAVPAVNNIVMSGILDDQSDRRTMNDEKVQFRIEPYVASELIKSIQNHKNLDIAESDISRFLKMLEDVAYKNMILWGEYTVSQGWFDFKQAMDEKRKFRDSLGF